MKKVVVILVAIMAVTIGVFAQNSNTAEIDAELCRIGNEDQEIRFKLMAAMQNNSSDLAAIRGEMISSDARNQTYVFNLLDTQGWLENLSTCANRAIFFVIQHASQSFQEKYFQLVKEKAEQGIVQKSDAAMLEDRILMRSGKRQKYGTQTVPHKTKDGGDVTIIWPIENAEKIDELRASVGLPPMTLYLQLVESQLNRKIIWDKNLTIDELNVSN